MGIDQAFATGFPLAIYFGVSPAIPLVTSWAIPSVIISAILSEIYSAISLNIPSSTSRAFFFGNLSGSSFGNFFLNIVFEYRFQEIPIFAKQLV